MLALAFFFFFCLALCIWRFFFPMISTPKVLLLCLSDRPSSPLISPFFDPFLLFFLAGIWALLFRHRIARFPPSSRGGRLFFFRQALFFQSTFRPLTVIVMPRPSVSGPDGFFFLGPSYFLCAPELFDRRTPGAVTYGRRNFLLFGRPIPLSFFFFIYSLRFSQFQEQILLGVLPPAPFLFIESGRLSFFFRQMCVFFSRNWAAFSGVLSASSQL